MNSLEQYLQTLPAMKAGKARKTLEKQQGFSGVIMNRHVWAELNAGSVTLDRQRARCITCMESGIFYDFCDITVAVVDYVEFLQNKMEREA